MALRLMTVSGLSRLPQSFTRIEPRFHISTLVSNRRADLDEPWPLPKQPPSTDGRNAHVEKFCNLYVVQQFGLLGERWRTFCCRIAGRRFDVWFFDLMAILQFDDSQVEPFDFFEGDQVYFSQKFNDPGLVGVHANGLCASGAARCPKSPSGKCVENVASHYRTLRL